MSIISLNLSELVEVLCYLIITISVILLCLWYYFQPGKEVCRCQTKLNGKVALVTGGNSGIGLETARDLARRGAKVIIASRDVAKSAEAVKDIINTTGNVNVQHRYLDLSKFKSIREFSEDFHNSGEQLHILVNNAGAIGLNNCLTEDGIDKVLQINYFGAALLTNLLLDKLEASAPSRIVVVSSLLHHRAKLDMHDLVAKDEPSYMMRYYNSKLCSILWVKALAKRLPKGVTANALHPGLVKTNFFQNMRPLLRIVFLKIVEIFFKTPKQGAQTCIHLCVSPDLEGRSGGYYSECRLRAPSKAARDDQLVEAVWEKTMEFIKQ